MSASPQDHAGSPADGYVLYGTQGSGSAIVEIGLQRCGAPFRVVHASSWEDRSAQDELRALNPLMQIPTLRTPEGAVLTESGAILMHLGLRFPQAGLLGDNDPRRDQILRGLVYIAANCYSCISVIDYPRRYTTSEDQAQHQAIVLGTKSRLHRHWELFADMFPPSPWLSGAQPGALDLMAVIVSKWSGSRPHLEQHRPEFFALLKRIEALPEVADVCARHWPPAR
ncbi:glutathione S-transferase [Roseateles aquatilis]|uniref:Glutathione S-transferase n=1 Tax=Roseateles aquatilis TaxID=431061 RepID=A0A246J7B2_9BURK|nr:glutathione S-transferase family protein [Roseateles aquatilis]OWQ88385.1 glutathione S-transferase [Roseateles aquatilis]